jgi:hypothetical protein
MKVVGFRAIIRTLEAKGCLSPSERLKLARLRDRQARLEAHIARAARDRAARRAVIDAAVLASGKAMLQDLREGSVRRD